VPINHLSPKWKWLYASAHLCLQLWCPLSLLNFNHWSFLLSVQKHVFMLYTYNIKTTLVPIKWIAECNIVLLEKDSKPRVEWRERDHYGVRFMQSFMQINLCRKKKLLINRIINKPNNLFSFVKLNTLKNDYRKYLTAFTTTYFEKLSMILRDRKFSKV